MFVYNHKNGKILFELLKKNNILVEDLISMFYSALHKFASEVFETPNKRLEFVVYDKYVIENIVIYDDINVDLIIAYNKTDHSIVQDLLNILIKLFNQNKELFYKCDMINFKLFENLKRKADNLICQYVECKILADEYYGELGTNCVSRILFTSYSGRV